MKLYFLGTPRTVHPDLGERSFHGRKTLGLLAHIAVEGQLSHSRDRLAGLFWPDLPERAARNNLRVTLARLAKGLGEAAPPYLLTDRHTVRLNPDADLWLDTAAFSDFVARTSAHNHTSRASCSVCHSDLLNAAALHTGAFLQDFYVEGCEAFDEWLFMQREHYHLAAGEVLADLSAYYEDEHDFALAEQYTRRHLRLEPLREDVHRSLMRLLTYQGNRSAALEQFQCCHSLLTSELGLEPGDETLALFERIQTGSEDAPQDAEAASRFPETQHRLPAQLTPFIGREQELLELRQNVERAHYRLLSIVGPGGIGKTRLALELALATQDQFRDGVFLVPLLGVSRVEDIPAAVSQSLGVTFSSTQGSVATQLLQSLKDKETLLILDNFEQLMAGIDFVLELLAHAPGVMLLVTSRERLNAQAENLFSLQGLAVPPDAASEARRYASVRLFVDRAHRLKKAFQLSDSNLPAVVRICQLVEGLPLALELAANWVQDYDCAEIASALENSLDFLQTSLHDVAPHHRSIRVVLERSWDLSSPAEQEVLARLSIFRGHFGAGAARQVASATPVMLSHLSHKTLLRSLGASRYEMHELLRQFAAEKLLDEVGARNKHSDLYLGRLVEQSTALAAANKDALDDITRDLDNIRQAWHWAVQTKKLDKLEKSLDALARFYDHAGLFEEGERIFAAAQKGITLVTRPDSDAEQVARLRIRLLSELVEFKNSQVPTSDILPMTQEIIRLATALGENRSAARAYYQWGRLILTQGDNDTALTLSHKGLELARECGDQGLQGLLLRFIGNVWRQRGHYQKLIDYLQQALTLQRELKNRHEEQIILTWLGVYGLKLHRYHASYSYLVQATELSQAMADPFKEFNTLQALAHAQARLGNYPQARDDLERAQQGFDNLGAKWHQVFALAELAIVYDKLNDPDTACQHAERAVSIAREANFAELKCMALGKSAYCLLSLERFQEAHDALCESLAGWQAIKNRSAVVETQACLVELYRRQGLLAEALAQAEQVLAYLDANSVDGVDEPSRMYLTLYQILAAQDDDRALALLERAVSFIQARAADISDPALKRFYLQGVTENRQLLALYNPVVT